MKFYNKIINSDSEISGLNSVLIHSLIGCNLKCYKCHNYEELVKEKHKDYYTEEDIINKIKLNGFLFDSIIFSGGEFLLESISDIEILINKIRNIFDGVIIVNTNGSMPDKIQYLLDKNIVDGIHLDVKINPFDINETFFEKIIGIKYNKKYINNLSESIKIVLKDNSKYSQLRTVKYPIVDKSYFDNIKNMIGYFKKEYNSEIEYRLNDFLEL